MTSAFLVETELTQEYESLQQGSVSHINSSLVDIAYEEHQTDSYFLSTNVIMIVDNSSSEINSFTTGSILGVSEDFIAGEFSTSNDITSGTIVGLSQDFIATDEYSYDNVNKNTISFDNPNSLESVNLVSVNYSPTQVVEEEIVVVKEIKTRDISRFRKSYSFTRNKPVRFRTTKRT
jgi:hypothetical protein